MGTNKEKISKYLAGIWVADGCNLSCAYCFQDQDRSQEMMSDEVLDATIVFIHKERPSGIAFFGGEPLMNKKAIKRIVLETNVPKYYLTTNGTLLDDEFLDMLADHKVWLNLSFDGTKFHHDSWRDNSYDRIMKYKDKLIDYFKNVGGQVLMTCVNEEILYEQVKHAKELGFPHVYINQLDSYSTKIQNNIENVERFKEQYRKVLTLHCDDFKISDYDRWQEFVKKGKKSGGHCGYNKYGLGISVSGKLFPCHRGPELPEKFAFGDVFTGFDRVKERFIRNMNTNSNKCNHCDLMFHQCPISAFHETGFIDSDPHDVHCVYERAKMEVIKEFMSIQNGLIDLKEDGVKV